MNKESLLQEIMKILSDQRLVNPPLIDDGYGEFPDVYKIGDSNLEKIKEKLKTLLIK